MTRKKKDVVAAPKWPADKVERRPIAELVPYARNARTHSAEQVKQLAASMREWGWTNPVLVDEQGGIIAGHGRILAAQSLGYAEAPVMVAEGWTEAQKRAYVIADNKLALNAGWDAEVLAVELDEIRDLDFDLKLTGFEAAELNDLIGTPNLGPPPTYSQKIEAPIYEPKGDRPNIDELIDDAKTAKLKEQIAAARLPPAIASFLEKAAERHTVFDFHRIADYYASASAEVQRLMEDSGLVIVDFDRAIENGFASLRDKLGAMAEGVKGAG